MRTILFAIALGLAVAIVVYVISGGHVLFLPLLFIPLCVFGLGFGRRR